MREWINRQWRASGKAPRLLIAATNPKTPVCTRWWSAIDQNSSPYLRHQAGIYHVMSPREFEKYLQCGLLNYGFLRIRCTDCGNENLVAYSCKCRGFCTSCGARRMAETTALLIDDVLPHKPFRQWVLSIPWPLRLLLANNPRAMGKVFVKWGRRD